MKVCLWVLNWQADVLIYMHGLWYQGSKIEKKIFYQNQLALYAFQFYSWNYAKLQNLAFFAPIWTLFSLTSRL